MASTKQPTIEDGVNSNYIDLTKTGPLTYRELRALDSSLPEESASNAQMSDHRGIARTLERAGKVNYTSLPTGLGDSFYDPGIANQDLIENLLDIRAEAQPWYAKIGAGLAKGTILVGTTFLDGTVGLLVGGVEALNRGDVSGFWDNDFSRAMQAVNEWSEEAMPNYYSLKELNSPWYENIFTANFIGDKLIRNMGFSIGALYSGGVTAAGLKATKLPQLIGAITNSAKAPAMVSSAIGGLASAVNEGRIEALNNSKTWQDQKLQELDISWRDVIQQRYTSDIKNLELEYSAALLEYEATRGSLQKTSPDGSSLVDPALQRYKAKLATLDAKKAALLNRMDLEYENRYSDESYTDVIGKIEEDRLKMGNADLAMNIPILTASNIFLFGKFYSNGFNTARRAGVRTVRDATGNIAGYNGKTFSATKAGLKIAKNFASESTEEWSQSAASNVAGNYYSTDINNFYKALIDPEAELETLSWIKSFAEGINQTINDGSAWEEWFIGGLTGVLGIPTIRGIRNADGSFRSPIEILGGAINAVRDYTQEIARSEEIANYLNQRVQSPEFLNYYRGLIRHNKYQNDMNKAVEEDDEFNFKNAEHALFVSDIIMFDSTGKLDDLRTFIDSAYDLSDENLLSIVENTTSTNESGDKIGPFVDKNGNPLYTTEEGKQQMIDKLSLTRDNMISTINNYRRTKNDIEVRTGGNLSDELLSEITWLKTLVDDWNSRALDMTPLIKNTLVNLSDNLETTLVKSITQSSMDGVEAIESTAEAADGIGIGMNRINLLRDLSLMEDKRLAALLTSLKNEKFVEGLIEDIDLFGSDIISALDKQNVIRLLSDLPKIGKGIETYNSKLEEYLADPNKIILDLIAAEESVNLEIQQKKNLDFRSALLLATSVKDFRDTVSQELDIQLSNGVIEDLIQEGNKVAKNYKEIKLYDLELRAALNSLGESSEVVLDALSLWGKHTDLAENLEQISNQGSVAINNEDAFLDNSSGDISVASTRFLSARYALQKAMSKVNSSINFKNRFAQAQEKPAPQPIQDKEETGDSKTATVPYVDTSRAPVEAPTTPVGDTSFRDIAAENMVTNDAVETQRSYDLKQQGQRKYYRPAIPEIHIEASKEGDFRPFDVVVAERERGVDFSRIYNYLRDNGAFDYVNAAKLKEGDAIGFMIDPEFNDHTIFLVDTRNNLIVGSLDESDASVARYEGLRELSKKIRDEYHNSDKQSRPSYDSNTGLLSDEYVESLIRNSPEIPYETLTWSEEQKKSIHSSGKSRIISLLDRKIVVIDINGFHMPFYLSSGHGGKVDVESGKWYPIFGLGLDGWLNKLTGTEINDYYGSPIFKQISEALDRIYGDIRNDESIPGVKATGSHVDFINQDLTPTEYNNSNTIELVEKNIAAAKSKVIEAASKLTTPTTGKFYTTPKVKVSEIMIGKIPYTLEERSLADIPGVMDGNSKPVFGIIKNGVLTTNGKIEDRLIIKPIDMAKKEGRLYLLIPNANGTYSPAAVRVKHFNTQEFNLDDTTIASTPMGKSVNEALDKLATASSLDDIALAMKDLSQDIYMQDVMVTWFEADAGSGIVISKRIRKSDGTYEIIDINGKELIKEEKTTIYFLNHKKEVSINGLEYSYAAAKVANVDLSLFQEPKETSVIRNDILRTILKYNLPLQVNVSKINESGYNNRLINSNILTSNLREAKVIGSWFTTSYFDALGNSQEAINPPSVTPVPNKRGPSPVGGSEGVIQGTRVYVRGTPYIVDLKSSIAVNEKTGEKRAFSAFNSQSLIDMAWAQETFGDATESSRMTENKIITPNGDVLDRSTGHYVTGEEAQRIKDKIAGRNGETENRIAQSKRVIADIYENQKKVDKARTDKDYYYILEEDGQYHQYSRVHSRLGDNWLGERTETENSKRALEAGTAVDKVIRDFFTSKEAPVRPETLSEGAFIDLITKLTEIKSKMEQLGETFMTNNIVLFQKYADGTRIAGEVDILSVDKNGNFKIYDVKTSRYSFSDRYFTEKSSMQRMSTKDYYTLQLSAYQNLFESQYGVRPTRLSILPFVLTYDKDKVNSITQEKGIPITYNPTVNVPLVSAVQAPKTGESLPIFDSTMETMITKPEEQNRVLPENAFEEGGEIGYYEKDGKLYTGYLKKIGEIEVTYGSGQKDMVPIHVTKVRDRGFGRAGEFGASSEYLTAFPNGKAISTRTNDTNDDHAAEVIMKALSAEPEKVLALSNEKTQIYNPRMLEELETEQRNRQYTPSTPTEQGGASRTVQRENAVNQKAAKRTRHKLRVVDGSRPTWDREKELAWLERVLPQLSTQERLRVVEGLIQVAENGPEAWGRFSDGIIELSDIAAEGTVYHEAFHAVFDLMMTSKERGNILIEARRKWGRKSYSELMELLAEDFREYVTIQEDKGWGSKILFFFKNLFTKVQNWGRIKPSLTAYYRAINKGKYSRRDFTNPITRNGQTTLNLESALQNNPFVAEFISRTSKLGYVLSGSAAYSLQGTVYRKVQDNLHDIDLIADRFHTSNPGYVLGALGYNFVMVNDFKNIRTYVVSRYPIHTIGNELIIVTPEGEFNSQQVLDREVPDTMMVDFILEPSEGVKTHKITVGRIDLVIQDAEQIENAKLDMSRDKDISDLANYGTGDRKTPITSWSSINTTTREALQKRGWTQEQFDRISQAERNRAVECVGL